MYACFGNLGRGAKEKKGREIGYESLNLYAMFKFWENVGNKKNKMMGVLVVIYQH